MNKDLGRFLVSFTAVMVIPAALVLFYIVSDPFMIIRRYDNYYENYFGSTNRDMAGSRTLIRQTEKGVHYESFILGSSLTQCILVPEWERVSGVKNAYHWDAHHEGIFGVWSKVKWLDSTNHPFKNVLLELDDILLSITANGGGFMYFKEPAIAGNSEAERQYEAIKSYFSNPFFLAHIHWYFSGKFLPYMEKYTLNPNSYYSNTKTNDLSYIQQMHLVKTDSAAFYKRLHGMSNLEPAFMPGNCVLNNESRQMLKDIKAVFDRKHVNYKVLLFPRVKRPVFCEKDIRFIQSVFGTEKVYYEPKTAYKITELNDFFDVHHAKPYFGTRLLEKMYKPQLPTVHLP
ncbi:MAG: hypothetical protein V4543_14460 [Bacteroidota bacterium]